MGASNVTERIVTVEEAFVARGRGVLIAPRFVAENTAILNFTDLARAPFEVRLALPNGESKTTTASLEVSHMKGALPPYAMIRLSEMSVADVPRGTEIWVDV